MIALKIRIAVLTVLALSSEYAAQHSRCDNGYCDEQLHCTLGFCCNNRCIDAKSPSIKTQQKGESCSICQACVDNLCCEQGVCADACGTSKGEYKCGCSSNSDCNPFYITGVKYACVQGQVPRSTEKNRCYNIIPQLTAMLVPANGGTHG